MQSQPDKKAIQEALRLANSPAGQQLINLLKSQSGETMDKARQQAQQGDLEQAKTTLSQVLQSPQVQQLLKEMEKRNE